MSPSHTAERTYAAIRQMLREGRLAPGARLETSRLATDLGVSPTPVRDALQRLAGEKLVEARIGDGFHVPRYTESALRDLFEWHAALLSMAARTVDIAALLEQERYGRAYERLASIVDDVSRAVPNREVGAALLNASDRLHPFRPGEEKVIADPDAEVAELAAHKGGITAAIRRFHLRRMRLSGEILKHREAYPV